VLELGVSVIEASGMAYGLTLSLPAPQSQAV
jgi:hypothetical protein